MWKEASKPSMPKISWIRPVISIQYWLVMDRRTNRQTVGHMTIANTMLAQRHVVKKLFSASNCYDRRTSCCSTESKRLHCCCHLPNTHTRCSLYFTTWGEMSSKLPLPMGQIAPTWYMDPWAHPTPNPKWSSIGSAIFVGLTVQKLKSGLYQQWCLCIQVQKRSSEQSMVIAKVLR